MRPAIHPSVIESALNGDESAPESSVRRRPVRRHSGIVRRPSLRQAVREMRIDASTAITLFVPGVETAALLLDRAISKRL